MLSNNTLVIPKACWALISTSIVLADCVVNGFCQVFMQVQRKQADNSYVTETLLVDLATIASGPPGQWHTWWIYPHHEKHQFFSFWNRFSRINS